MYRTKDTMNSYVGCLGIPMTYKIKKRKMEIKNLFLPFLYPEPEPSLRATGSPHQFPMSKKSERVEPFRFVILYPQPDCFPNLF